MTSTEPGMQLGVRSCYASLFDLIRQLTKPGGGVTLTGNPGIGRPFFWLLAKLISAQEKAGS